MFSSLKLVTLFGIPVKVHWTFALFIGWIAFLAFTQGIGLPGMLVTLFLISLIFICVVLHEYGHALTARRYGVNTKDIILSPIGGIARLENIPEKPLEEFIIAIAGPMVNVVIAALIIAAYLVFSGEMLPLTSLGFWSFEEAQPLGWILLKINLILIAFNIIPAFPMDGGRMARALLSIRFGRITATRIASYLGRGLAIAFIVYGIFQGNVILSIIGIFVFMAAAGEYRSVLFEQTLNRYSLREVLRPNFTKIYLNDLMQQPAGLLMHTNETHFLVFNADENLAGILPRRLIIKAMQENLLQMPVEEFVSDNYVPVHPDTSLIEVFRTFQSGAYDILPVVDENRILGVIDRQIMNNLMELASNQISNGNLLKVVGRKKGSGKEVSA